MAVIIEGPILYFLTPVSVMQDNKVCLLVFVSFAPELVSYWAPRDLHRRAAYSFCESSFLIHHGVHHDLFVCP